MTGTKEPKGELVTQPESREMQAPMATPDPMQLIAAMVEKGVDTTQLEQMMDLQDRWEKKEAKKAWAAAFARFQGKVPIIKQDKMGDKAPYASYKEILKTVQPYLKAEGLSVRVTTELNESQTIMTAVCHITHRDGHTEINSFPVPLDLGPTNREGKRVMNGAQAYASASSYAKRYGLKNGLNLAEENEPEDDDAEGAGKELLTEEQCAEVSDYLESLGSKVNLAAFWKFAGADSVDTIPAAKYGAIIHFLKQKEGK